MKDPNYDFKAPLEKTATHLAKVILSEIADAADTLIYEDKKFTPEEEKANDEKATDFAIKIMRIVGSTDIPADYASYPIDKIKIIFNILQKYIDGTTRQVKDEIMSRTLEVKSPKTGKYAQDCATMADLMLKLNEARENTGGDENDYFNTPSADEGQVVE